MTKYTRLKAVGTEEFPDTRLSFAAAQQIKKLAQELAEGATVDELMFLAGALEDEARKKRGR